MSDPLLHPRRARPPARTRGAVAIALLLACDPAPAPAARDAPASPVLEHSPRPALAPVPEDSPHPSLPANPAPVPEHSPPPALPASPAPVPEHSPRHAPAPVPEHSPRPPPPGFVDLRVALPGACFTAGYAAVDNFTGAPLPGYATAGAWLLAEPAAALATAQRALAADGLTLLIFDAYRPRRASEAMVAWAHRTGGSQLVTDGYIATRSGHNHGHTIDLGLARVGTCEPLDMGTAWDTLDERSHTHNATGPARTHRLRLLTAMRAAGFRGYDKEWWHFGFPLAGTRPRDVPYGRHEPDEPDPP